MPVMIELRLALRRRLLACLIALALGCLLKENLLAEGKAPTGSLEALANDFWQWRARYQPFSKDDIPRIERPIEDRAGPRDWSASSIAKQKAMLEDFEKQWRQIDTTGWSVARRVDYRLMGSALARVRWELDVNPRWQRDPAFYVEQTVGALQEGLMPPAPLGDERAREIVARTENIPAILEQAKLNLKAIAAFAQLTIAELSDIDLR